MQDKDGVHFEHESALNYAAVFGKDWGLLKQEYTRLQIVDEVESRYGTYDTTRLADGTLEMELEVEVQV